jgi:Radical SAM superfamily
MTLELATSSSESTTGSHSLTTPASSRDAAQKLLLDELKLKIALGVNGISFAVEDIQKFPIGTEIQEQIHLLFDMDKEHHDGFELPAGFWLPHGLFTAFRWDAESPYVLREENGKAVLHHWSNRTRSYTRIAELDWYKRSHLLDYKTSDGEHFDHITAFTPEGGLAVCYSNECDLKGTGDDCKYCNINSTADAYRSQNIFLKSPKQVGEVYERAFREGHANHVNITGGFIPERREVDYYLDIAEEIKDRTGQDEIYGTAVIGAPLDLDVLSKYKEAGFKTLGMNIEIWDKDIFRAICPGKEKRCGGREHWAKALVLGAEIFGKGYVRTNIVAGIEPKESILEGVEYLASKGVIAHANAWCPNPGSELEAHRTPEVDWHYDLTLQVSAIHRKYGFTLEQIYAGAGASAPAHDVYRIFTEDLGQGHLSQYRHPTLS